MKRSHVIMSLAVCCGLLSAAQGAPDRSLMSDAYWKIWNDAEQDILQISLQTYIVDVFLVVAKVMDGSFGIEPGTRFEEVGAETLGREVGIDGLKSCARQELTEVQVVDTALGIIGHQTLVEVRLQRGTGLS